MSKILILNIPMHGHINPTIALTKELVKRGHDVTYLINEEFSLLCQPSITKPWKLARTLTALSMKWDFSLELNLVKN